MGSRRAAVSLVGRASTVYTAWSNSAKTANGPHSFWTCHWRRRPMSVSVSTRSPLLVVSSLAYPTRRARGRPR